MLGAEGSGPKVPKEGDMRRMLVFAMLTALLSLQGTPAQSEPSERTRYESTWINAFWYSRERVDRDTYRRITWYAGAYDSGTEGGFWSDLYRSVLECEKREGRDRCHYVRRLSWYGDTHRGTFTIDRKLMTSHLEVSYRVYGYSHGEQELVGRFHVVTDATGVGGLAHGRSSYTYHLGCISYTYSGKWASRQASATGSLALGDEEARSLGETDDAALGRSEDVSIQHDC